MNTEIESSVESELAFSDTKASLVPISITPTILKETLRCSESQRRKLTAILRRSDPYAWPARLDEDQFYDALLEFLKEPGARQRYTLAADLVEKKKKPLNLPLAFFRATIRRYSSDPDFLDVRSNINSDDIDTVAELVEWIAISGSIDEAVNLAWALLDSHPELLEHLCEHRENKQFKDALVSLAIEAAVSSPDASRGETHALEKLKYSVAEFKDLVAGLDAEHISDGCLKTVESYLATINAALSDAIAYRRSQEEAQGQQISALIGEALAQLEQAGVPLPEAEELRAKLSASGDATVQAITEQVADLDSSNAAVRVATSKLAEAFRKETLEDLNRLSSARDSIAHALLAALGHHMEAQVSGREEGVPGNSANAESAEPPKASVVNLIQNTNDTGGFALEKGAASGLDKNKGPSSAHRDNNRTKDAGATSNENSTLADATSVSGGGGREEWPVLANYACSGEVAKCYWLLRAAEELDGESLLPSTLVGAVAEAGQLIPSGSAGPQLRSLLDASLKVDLDISGQLLAASALLPTALFCAQTPTSVYTLASQNKSGIPAVDAVIEEVVRVCLYQEACVRMADIEELSSLQADETELKQVVTDARSLQYQMPHFSINFRPAAEAFREAFRERSELGRVLAAVAGNKQKDRRWVERYMEQLDLDDALDAIMEGRRHRGRPIPQVQGAARNKMLYHLDQVQQLARSWLEMTGGMQGEKAEQVRKEVVRLVSRLKTSLPSATQILRTQNTTDDDRNVAAQIACVAFDRAARVLSGDLKSLDQGLTSTLVLQGRVPLSHDLACPADPPAYEVLKADLLSGYTYTLDEAVNACLSRNEYGRALCLTNMPGAEPELEDVVRSAVERGRAEIMDTLEEAETAIEDAYLLGLLSDYETPETAAPGLSSRSSLMATLAEVRKASTGSGVDQDLTLAWQELNEIKGKVTRLRLEREKSNLQELDKLISRMKAGTDDEKEDGEYLKCTRDSFIQQNDNIALNELLARARHAIANGTGVPRATEARGSLLAEFLASEPEIAKSWPNAQRAAGDIANQRNVAGVVFADKDKQYCQIVAGAIRTWVKLQNWNDTKEGRANVADRVTEILRFLKIPVLARSEASVVLRDHYALLDVALEHRIVDSPIPSFGSAIAERLKVLVIRTKVPDREVAKVLEQEKLDRKSVLILYLPAMKPTERKSFRARAADRHLSALILDYSLFMFVASTRDPLPALFEVGLPFLWSQPYLMKGENVAPEMFVGRAEEVRQVLDAEGTCIIFGGRQLGKSALLRHVQLEYHDTKKGLKIAYCDIDDLGNEPQDHSAMEKELWKRLSQELCHVDFLNRSSLPDLRKKDFAGSIQNLIRERLNASSEARLIILLDESDDFLELDATEDFRLVKQIRQLMVSTKRRFKVVFAGLQSVQRFESYHNHPFAQLGRGLPITPLPPVPAQRLVAEPMRALGYIFDESGLVLRILSQTNYHPGLVQIFCHRLLERMYQTPSGGAGALRVISRQDVQAIERTPEFMEDIRNRFDWTLDLDDRYKVLIYALVLSGNSTEAYEDCGFLEFGKEWWPSVFDGLELQTMRALLDEMVGLGVLSAEHQSDTKTYRLRSPNLLRLLGKTEEIEAELLRLVSQKRPRKPNPASYRRQLGKKPPTFGPLTMEQEAKIPPSSHHFEVRVILGGRAMGIDGVNEHVKSALEGLREYGEQWTTIEVPLSKVAQGALKVGQVLKERFRSKARHHLCAIFSYSCSPSDQSPANFVSTIADILGNTCRNQSKGLVIVLLDEDASWRWLADHDREEVLESGRIQQMNLRRWAASAFAKALEDLGMRSKAKDHAELLLLATQGRFVLGQEVLRAVEKQKISEWTEEAIKTLADSLRSEKTLPRFDDVLLRAAVEKLYDMGGGQPFDWATAMMLLEEEDDLNPKMLARDGSIFREWLQVTGLAGPLGEDGHLTIIDLP